MAKEIELVSGGTGSEADQQEYARVQLRETGLAADQDEYEKVDRRQRERAKQDKIPVRPEILYTSTPRESSSSSEEEGETAAVARKRLVFGPNEYRDEEGKHVNAKGGPLDCPLGNPLCEYGVTGGAGWECWNHHPQASQLVLDPRFWADYAGENLFAGGRQRRDGEE
ncbi:hypothetical protein AAFF_G00431900 [Aldrovandia affinis]|uniref:Uncharacterized protein n=1 Tax=Aldrovandia affinis TaxID=143900 RepID=A0AAD7WIJ2_9TELE|nr:hypothetical protein AAFF_G00431900 [Aldrovandia affinis]